MKGITCMEATADSLRVQDIHYIGQHSGFLFSFYLFVRRFSHSNFPMCGYVFVFGFYAQVFFILCILCTNKRFYITQVNFLLPDYRQFSVSFDMHVQQHVVTYVQFVLARNECKFIWPYQAIWGKACKSYISILSNQVLLSRSEVLNKRIECNRIIKR